MEFVIYFLNLQNSRVTFLHLKQLSFDLLKKKMSRTTDDLSRDAFNIL